MIEKRLKLKKDKKLLERQIHELKSLYSREVIRYQQQEADKERQRGEKIESCVMQEEKRYWEHLHALQRGESFKSIEIRNKKYQDRLSELELEARKIARRLLKLETGKQQHY